MRKVIAFIGAVSALLLIAAAPALACGGLVNPNGTVTLTKTTTLAAYADGIEHYVTSFEYAGGGGEFGSIVPLPAIPSKVERGGDWTLQRLVQEVQPPARDLAVLTADAGGESAEVLYETKIDALDISILKGGGDEVGRWAEENGFTLTPDTPEVLDFYARRSPIFMAARFDASRAERLGQQVGDGTPIHLTIPTQQPWVPLRILSLGLGERAKIEADVFLLTESVPQMLPQPGTTFDLARSERASAGLIADLRSDKGMRWLPDDMWLSYLKLDARAGELTHDLAIDAAGRTRPSPVAAGLELPLPLPAPDQGGAPVWLWVLPIIGGLAVLGLARSGA